MKGKNDFIDYVKTIVKEEELTEEALKFWNYFKENKDVEKPLFTENGKKIFIFLKNNLDKDLWKAKEIADQMGISSRAVSGAIRKLVSDGFVEKVSVDPIIYTLTELGKNYNIEESENNN